MLGGLVLAALLMTGPPCDPIAENIGPYSPTPALSWEYDDALIDAWAIDGFRVYVKAFDHYSEWELLADLPIRDSVYHCDAPSYPYGQCFPIPQGVGLTGRGWSSFMVQRYELDSLGDELMAGQVVSYMVAAYRWGYPGEGPPFRIESDPSVTIEICVPILWVFDPDGIGSWLTNE